MTNPKQERRYRRTEALILNGFTTLLQQKSVKDITVRELSDLVDINRSTFYLHYTDIYDLMEKTEQRLLDKFFEAVDNTWTGAKEDFFIFLEQMYKLMQENSALCLVLMGPNGDIAFIRRVEEIIREKGLETLRSFAPKELHEQDLQYAVSYAMSGCLGLIHNWLKNNCQDSSTHMAELTFVLLREGTSSIGVPASLH